MRTALLMATTALVLGATFAPATEVHWTPAHELAPPGGPLGYMTWGDLDDDGDDDICASLEYWNDGGCPGPPVWREEPRVLPGVAGCATCASTLGDLDTDGDLDVILGCADGGLRLFWNVGTPSAAQWQYDPSFFTPGGCQRSIPRLADLDADGDLDVVAICGEGGGVWFGENTGTPQMPTWPTPWQGLPIPSLPTISTITVGDIDGDADLDIVGITTWTAMRCWENVGTPQAWQFVENPAMLGGVDQPAEGGWTIALPDIDCDGDPDLLALGWNGACYLYLNDVISPVTPTSWGIIKGLYR